MKVCHKCRRELPYDTRILRSEQCPWCSADLHCCLNCRFHDPSAYNECRESSAESVRDRDRANRCEYFAPGDRESGRGDSAREAARSALDDLFEKS